MTIKHKLLIIGAGGHGKVVADCANEMQTFSEIAFLDDTYPSLQQQMKWPVLHDTKHYQQYVEQGWQGFVAIGNNLVREQWQEKLSAAGAQIATLVHPQATVSSASSLGPGTLVLAGAVINIAAKVGEGSIINTATTVDHDCMIDAYCHLAPGCHLAGNISIGKGTFLGVGTNVIPNIKIGKHSIVGAGSTVIADIADKVTVVGSPARVIKQH